LKLLQQLLHKLLDGVCLKLLSFEPVILAVDLKVRELGLSHVVHLLGRSVYALAVLFNAFADRKCLLICYFFSQRSFFLVFLVVTKKILKFFKNEIGHVQNRVQRSKAFMRKRIRECGLVSILDIC